MDSISASHNKKRKKYGIGLAILLMVLILLGFRFQKSMIRETGPGLEKAAEAIKSGEPMGEVLEVFLERNLP